jgi:fatty-acyl-CoA synthase
MTAREWSIPAVLDVVSGAVPARQMLVGPSTRRTYREVRERSLGLAAFLVQHGLGVRPAGRRLERWECGQSTVAIVASNCVEYIEGMIGAYRARTVPFNVNHHYHRQELNAILDQMDTEAIIYQRRFGPMFDRVGSGEQRLLLEIEDGSDVDRIPGAHTFESAVRTPADAMDLPAPNPDDLYVICTGGTTGAPKGVLWRQADIYVSGMGGLENATPASLAEIAVAEDSTWFATPPLMHAAGQRTVFSCVLRGGTAVLHDDRSAFDARALLETAGRERVTVMTIVGDAYARRLIDELQRRKYDLSSLQRIGTGGASTSPESKAVLLDLLPHIVILDTYSSSETGGIARSTSRQGQWHSDFALTKEAVVLSPDRTRLLEPGDPEIGWTARRGRIPLGYLNDPDQTERTFPIVDGVRLAVPGDRARLCPDGSIELLGRDSTVINSGGEKVFVEEVEQAVRRHPDVADAVVVGRPSQHFGSEVVAVVELRPDARVTPNEIRETAAQTIARFKAPRAVLFCSAVPRHASGKADYARARQMASDAVSAVSPEPRA